MYTLPGTWQAFQIHEQADIPAVLYGFRGPIKATLSNQFQEPAFIGD
jgi:hypothetical protein